MTTALLDKIQYKKVRVGLVKKEGKTYVKYRKVRRFKKIPYAQHVLLGVLLAILGYMLNFLYTGKGLWL